MDMDSRARFEFGRADSLYQLMRHHRVIQDEWNERFQEMMTARARNDPPPSRSWELSGLEAKMGVISGRLDWRADGWREELYPLVDLYEDYDEGLERLIPIMRERGFLDGYRRKQPRAADG